MILKTDSITEIRHSIRGWVELLADGRFEDAAKEMSTSASEVSASVIRDAIGRYSRAFREAPEQDKLKHLPQVTAPQHLQSSGENMVLYVKPGEAIVEYDLPISGQWSDLTAKFRINNSKPSGFDLALVDIRVL